MEAAKKINIVLAEDDYLISEEIARIIRSLGFNVIGVAPNGEKAVQLVNELKPDIVIMDIQMPKLNGLDAALRIQETMPTPIIILTAYESPDLIHEASTRGVGAYLTKPPEANDLERAVYISIARFQDLVKLRKLNEELEEQKRELTEANITKDKFFSVIAHDLKNPFQALMVMSEYTLDEIETMDISEVKESLKSIWEISTSTYKLFENLLNWSRLQTGKIVPEFERFQLTDIVSTIMKLYTGTAGSKGISLETNLPEYTIELNADKNMIETVLRNLVSNALKFTKKEGKVIISAKEDDSFTTIEVEDTGIGISENRLSTLLDGLVKEATYDTNNEKSTGLGLLISNDFIKLHNGKIGVESKTNVGTKFTITLPKFNDM